MKKCKKVLIIRYHAFGDTIAILPYVNGLKDQLPEAKFYLLTMGIASVLPDNCELFDKVYTTKGGKISKWALFWTLMKLPSMIFKKFDLVVDLQNDRKSNLIKFVLADRKPATFDKTATIFAGERYRQAIMNLGFHDLKPNFNLKVKQKEVGLKKLYLHGYQEQDKLIIFNPAGYFITRNWPIENYLKLFELMISKIDGRFKVLLMGDDRIEEKANKIQAAFPEQTINLVNKTSPIEAFNILVKADVVFSEDSGLAHMAWIQGIKTLLMLGSTRADWTAPPYHHVTCLTSSDLPCGDCMKSICEHGDVRCLTRYSPKFILEKILKIIDD